MELQEFVEFHRPALEQDEARYNLILGLLGRMLETGQSNVRLWTIGAPGECAMQTPGYPLILGRLGAAQCQAFAEATLDIDYPGVVGLDPIVPLFVERANELGVKFKETIPQTIQALQCRPIYPNVSGTARVVGHGDVALFSEWLLAFFREVVPHEPVPSRDRLESTATAGNYQFWVVDGEPVAMAGIVRRSRHAAAIAGVYTYRGCATAAMAARRRLRQLKRYLPKAGRPPASTPTCAIPPRTAAMPRSVSSRCVVPGTTSGPDC